MNNIYEYLNLVVHPVRRGFWCCPECDEPYAHTDWPKDSHIYAWSKHQDWCPAVRDGVIGST
jgi:hypothetical protein